MSAPHLADTWTVPLLVLLAFPLSWLPVHLTLQEALSPAFHYKGDAWWERSRLFEEAALGRLSRAVLSACIAMFALLAAVGSGYSPVWALAAGLCSYAGGAAALVSTQRALGWGPVMGLPASLRDDLLGAWYGSMWVPVIFPLTVSVLMFPRCWVGALLALAFVVYWYRTGGLVILKLLGLAREAPTEFQARARAVARDLGSQLRAVVVLRMETMEAFAQPSSGTVCFSEAFWRLLEDDAHREALLAHELAHLSAPWKPEAGYPLGLFLFGFGSLECFRGAAGSISVGGSLKTGWPLAVAFLPGLLCFLAMMAVVFWLVRLSVGNQTRHDHERSADATACRLAGRAVYGEALLRGFRSCQMALEESAGHPSLRERLELLEIEVPFPPRPPDAPTPSLLDGKVLRCAKPALLSILLYAFATLSAGVRGDIRPERFQLARRAVTLMHDGEFTRALPLIERAASQAEDPDVQAMLALALWNLGEDGTADEAAQRARDLYADYRLSQTSRAIAEWVSYEP